jgi:hypothetical protein
MKLRDDNGEFKKRMLSPPVTEAVGGNLSRREEPSEFKEGWSALRV